MNIKRSFFIYFVFLITLASAFAAGYLTHALVTPQMPDFPILAEAYAILKSHAYDELPAPPAIEYGMIRGMTDAYNDPYTRFVEPAQHELYTNNLEGSYGGIGASLDRDADGYIILFPFPDGPANMAGILDGDRLLKADEVVITPETTTEEAISAIRGPEGEKVTIEITRPPQHDRFTFSIKRENFPIPSVTWRVDVSQPKIGMIQVNRISAETPEEIQTAIQDLESQNATHFVLDLRGNGGGLLDSGIDIARLFLEDGTVIERRSRGEEVQSYPIEQPGPLAGIPLVVFVDANTASAAEVIAGALQANGRAPLIGTHTFGKDSIQMIFDLQDESSLHVTSSKWWVPGLDSPVGEGGLKPDFEVSPEVTDPDPYLQYAIQIFFGELP